MKQFTIELRDALLDLDKRGIELPLPPSSIEFAGQTLRVGRYGRNKGYAKAFLIVTSSGNVHYCNKDGKLSKRLTAKAFLTHWEAGMSTFLGDFDIMPI